MHIYHREIWQSAFLKDRSLKGRTFAVMRVLSITFTVVNESRAATRAAALGFSSLLGLGPLLAIAVLVAGFALGETDSTKIAHTLDSMVKFVAPQLAKYEEATPAEAIVIDRALDGFFGQLDRASAAADNSPTLVDTIDGIIKASQNGTIGPAAVFSLLVVVLLMFKGVEDTFNDIWGVRQGRSLLMRVVLYWTVLSLGSALFFTAVALQSAGTFSNVFKDILPDYAQRFASGWTFQVLSFLMLAMMLTLFYRVIPNTRVFWGPAAIGAVVVTGLLAVNNFAAFLYVKRVVLDKNLYGGLALPLVLLSVLYIFWLCVLLGGIVSYAIQNVHFRNSQAAWSTLTESMRERLALVVFLTVCRRFRDCLPPISASHLSEMLKVPTQLLNECLNRLVRTQLITTLRPPPESTATDYLYQPSRPLNKMTLFDFKTLDDNLGEDLVGASLDRIDPLVSHYDEALNQMGQQEFFKLTVEDLLEKYPFDESRPPFAMGARRKE